MANSKAIGVCYEDLAILGTSTNDNSASGYVGEYKEANLLLASAVSLTTATAANITSIVLTPGDWDVEGMIAFVPAATTSITQFNASLSTTSATLASNAPSTSTATNIGPFATNVTNHAAYVPTAEVDHQTTRVRFSVSAQTTVYLVAEAAFTVSTMTAYGSISARRVR